MQPVSFRVQAALYIEFPRDGVIDTRGDRDRVHGVKIDEKDVVRQDVYKRQVFVPYLMSGIAFSTMYFSMFSRPHLGGLDVYKRQAY